LPRWYWYSSWHGGGDQFGAAQVGAAVVLVSAWLCCRRGMVAADIVV